MKAIILCVGVFLVPLCSAVPHHGGHSNSFRKQDDHGNYAFGYDIKDGHGAVNGRQEQGTHGHVVGSYYIGDIDGRHRTVHYVADKLGFRAQIKTNEPGTKSSYTAGAHYASANGKLIPSGSLHAPYLAKPIVAAPIIAAPYHGYGHGYGGHGAGFGGYGGGYGGGFGGGYGGYGGGYGHGGGYGRGGYGGPFYG